MVRRLILDPNDARTREKIPIRRGSRAFQRSFAASRMKKRAGRSSGSPGSRSLSGGRFQPVEPFRSGAGAPHRKQESDVGTADFAVTVQVLGATGARAPRRQQESEVRPVDFTVAVEVAGAVVTATTIGVDDAWGVRGGRLGARRIEGADVPDAGRGGSAGN